MRPLLTAATPVLLLLISPLFVGSQESPARKDEVKMTEAGRNATKRALEWLKGKQNADGSWSEPAYPHSTAITSFALLAFLSQGHLPNQGIHGETVAKASRFLMASAQPNGYLVGRGGRDNMYSHGITALALAELWGATGDKQVKPILKKSVDLIVGCQSPEGGWRYQPVRSGADISVTIMQVMALRAAKNSGLHVRDDTMKKAIAYIRTCYDDRSGGFTYQPRSAAAGFARTSAGVCVLYLTGEHKSAEIGRAVQYMKDHFNDRHHFWYGHYYASHAMHQVGGKEWKEWYTRMNSHFLAKQQADGSWSQPDPGSPGPIYQTSIAVIGLSVPMHYLPIFQR